MAIISIRFAKKEMDSKSILKKKKLKALVRAFQGHTQSSRADREESTSKQI